MSYSTVMYHSFVQTRLQKVLLALVALGLLLLATYWWWVPRATVAYLLYGLRHEPSLTITPTQMQLSDASVLRGKAYTLEHLSFESPWSDESHAQNVPGYSASYTFGQVQQGKHVRTLTVVKDPPLSSSVLDTSPDIQKFFNSTAQTNFTVYDYMMRLTPSSVDVLASPAASLPKVLLLTIKGNMGILGEKMYSFQNKNGIKGFTTQKNASTTIAEFFTPADREYTMILDGASVAERDSVLNSLQER